MEIFVAIIPFAAVVAIAVWSATLTYRLARPRLDDALGGAGERGSRV